jgi:hypothetical protein
MTSKKSDNVNCFEDMKGCCMKTSVATSSVEQKL